MTVLVTGGAGFSGSHVIGRLPARGHSVVCVDELDRHDDSEIKHCAIASALRGPAFRLAVGGIKDLEFMRLIFGSSSPAYGAQAQASFHKGDAADLAIHRSTCARHGGREIDIDEDERSTRGYTYGDGIVDGVTACLDQTPALGFEIVNLGSATPMTLGDPILTLERITGREARIRREPADPVDMQRTHARVEKAACLRMWEPRMPCDTGIRRFVA